MGIGPKIKEFRSKAGFTQKELADKLHVTYQAVSRWEKDSAEPSFDTLKELCKVLDCSTDDLFGIESAGKTRGGARGEKPMLAVCEQCNKPIYDGSDLFRVTETYHTGRTRRERQLVLCGACNDIRLGREKAENERKAREKTADFRKTRIKSFIWGAVCLAAFIFLGVCCLSTDAKSAYTCFGLGAVGFFFVGTLVLDNTFLPDLWYGFLETTIHWPGVIFELSLDGCLFQLGVKLAFAAAGFVIGAAVAIFGTLLCAPLSLIVYPFALVRSFREIDD